MCRFYDKIRYSKFRNKCLNRMRISAFHLFEEILYSQRRCVMIRNALWDAHIQLKYLFLTFFRGGKLRNANVNNAIVTLCISAADLGFLFVLCKKSLNIPMKLQKVFPWGIFTDHVCSPKEWGGPPWTCFQRKTRRQTMGHLSFPDLHGHYTVNSSSQPLNVRRYLSISIIKKEFAK